VGRLLAITGGHRFDLDAFRSMLDSVCGRLGWEWSHATQPAAQRWLRPEHRGVWDVIFLYDIPGLTLTRGEAPRGQAPSDETKTWMLELLSAGQGVVAVHHALAGWPMWDEWAHILGGRFLYTPGRLDGTDVPASGYRMDTYTVDVIDPDHPVTRGVSSFSVTDELYLCPIFEDEVTPLLTTASDTAAERMTDAYREVRFGEQHPASGQAGSNLVAWTRQHGRSRVVYLLPGHGPSTMEHEMYRRLLANACVFVAHTNDEASATVRLR
jgi:type 1 glutamine amidotransferase